MKKYIAILVIALAGISQVQAQDTMSKKMDKMDDKIQTISLDQSPGEFAQKSITVDAGTYVFTVNNKDVGHNVGFVLVPKGKDISKPENHIKTAYVTAPVANNETGHSNATTLTPGEYVYFCPLNPTATDNLLIVK